MATASHGPIPPRWMAALKMKNLPQKPAKGGIPARETMNMVMAMARAGGPAARTRRSRRSGCRGDSRAIPMTTANAPRFITP